MQPQVLFRHDHDTAEEFEICKGYFPTTDQRMALLSNSLVVGRYSCLPYYRELEKDLEIQGSRLINSHLEHQYIANMEWLEDLKGLTFDTWDRLEDAPDIPLVLKGRTNSRKFEWDTKMLAKNKRHAIDITSELMNDPLIGPQGVVYRRYEPLETYEVGLNGMPMTNEWRCFFYKKAILTHGFYWSIIDDDSIIKKAEKQFMGEGLDLAFEGAKIVSEHTNFFVLDVARKEDGEWVIVEVNDGQMSGLSCNDPHKLYERLSLCLNGL